MRATVAAAAVTFFEIGKAVMLAPVNNDLVFPACDALATTLFKHSLERQWKKDCYRVDSTRDPLQLQN